jgi:hypothetical protein
MSKVTNYVVESPVHLGPIARTLAKGTVVAVGDGFIRVDGREYGDDAGRQAARTIVKMAEMKTAYFRKEMELDTTEVDIKSATSAVWPILGCMRAAEDFLSRLIDWQAMSSTQEEFLFAYAAHVAGVEDLGSLIKRIANSDRKVINQWLKDNGFDIQLTQEVGKDGFAVASILDVLCEWMAEGVRTTIEKPGASYPAVKLKKDDGVSLVQHPDLHGHPIIRIRTKSGDRVCMTVAADIPEGLLGLHSKVRSLQLASTPDYRYEGVIFPMVHYDRHEDISFLVGMRIKESKYYINEAVQQTRFRMNEKGARAESAAAMGVRCFSMGAERKPYVLDRPFILWIEREGVAIPLFMAVFAEDVWKDPKTLE